MKFLAGVIVGIVLSVIGVDGTTRLITNSIEGVKSYSQGLAN
jgi:hypothetical protein